MKMKLLFSLVFASAVALFTGCVGTLDGHSKAAVNPMGRDKIVRRYDRSVAQTAVATKEVLSREGNKLTSYDTVNNSFAATVKDFNVWVKLIEVEPKLTEITVQARAGMAANIDLASEISTQIALQLATNP